MYATQESFADAADAARTADTAGETARRAALHLDWSSLSLNFANGADALMRGISRIRGVSGVYLIWTSNPSGPVCLLAGGARDIGERIARHAADPRVTRHAWSGEMRVDWAAVASMHRSGALNYIGDALAPVHRDSAPATRAVPVNLPA